MASRNIARIIGTVLLVIAIVDFAAAQAKTLNDLVRYGGADRERLLYQGAQKEGKLVWYTTLTVHKELAKVFQAKYRGVAVEVYRGPGTTVATKLLQESQAKRFIADTIETPFPTLLFLRENNVLFPFTSPHLAKYPENAKDNASGGMVYTALYRESYTGVVYNTKLIRDADVPRKFDDLLKPTLKGKMGLPNAESALRGVGAIVTAKGENFLKSLAGQGIKQYSMGALGLTDLIVTGELPLMLTGFKSNADLAASKGAPIAWAPMELVATNAGGAAVVANAPHPHAALLFVDFLISPEGQKVMAEQFGYGSAAKEYGFKKWYPEQGLSYQKYEELTEKWQKQLAELVRK